MASDSVLVGSNAASLLHTASEEFVGSSALATNLGLSKCHPALSPLIHTAALCVYRISQAQVLYEGLEILV